MLGVAGAQEYVAASLMRVGKKKSTAQFAHNGKTDGGREGERRNPGSKKAPLDQIKCFKQHILESFHSQHQHVREATYLREKQFTQESNVRLKA